MEAVEGETRQVVGFVLKEKRERQKIIDGVDKTNERIKRLREAEIRDTE